MNNLGSHASGPLRAAELPPGKAVPLRVTFSWTLLGYVAYAGCQWGNVVIIAKLGDPTMLGQFALALSITAPIIQFFNLQLRGIQVADAAGEYSFGDYLALRLLTSGLALLSIAAILVAMRSSTQTTRIIFVFAIAKTVEAIAEAFFGLLQKHERMDRVAISLVLRGVTSMLAVGLTLSAVADLYLGVVAMAVASLLLLFVFDIPSARLVLEPARRFRLLATHRERARFVFDGDFRFGSGVRPRWNRRQLTSLARTGLPLGMLVLLISLNSSLPNYVIGRLRGETDLGLFAAMAFLAMVPTMVINALGQSATSRLARAFTTGQYDAFRALTYRLVLLASVVGIAGVVAAAVIGRPILTLLYTPRYAEHLGVFVTLMAGAGFACVASVIGVSLTATRCFAPQLPVGMLVTAVTAVTCLWLVHLWGLQGAAWAIVVSYASQAGGLAVLLTRRLRQSLQVPDPRSGASYPAKAAVPEELGVRR